MIYVYEYIDGLPGLKTVFKMRLSNKQFGPKDLVNLDAQNVEVWKTNENSPMKNVLFAGDQVIAVAIIVLLL